jgi:hypothetical protein
MLTPAPTEILSPSDRKVIRLEDWRRDRLRQRPMPTLRVAVWMVPSNDPTPPTGAPAAALRAA